MTQLHYYFGGSLTSFEGPVWTGGIKEEHPCGPQACMDGFFHVSVTAVMCVYLMSLTTTLYIYI